MTILDEIAQAQGNKYHMFSLIFAIRMKWEGKDCKESTVWNLGGRKHEMGEIRKDSGGLGVSILCIYSTHLWELQNETPYLVQLTQKEAEKEGPDS